MLTRWSNATDPHPSLGEWEDPHLWWTQGRCKDCHRPLKDGETIGVGKAGERPSSHKEEHWREFHGRATGSSESRCYVCHSSNTCRDCHDHPPTTHTKEFKRPSGDGVDAARHTLLGRMRPSSCLVCHGSFVTMCTKCHAPGEVQEWQDRALSDLDHWPTLLDSLRKHKPLSAEQQADVDEQEPADDKPASTDH
ncbi:MAG: hypothetical protein CMJ48_01455 [Planctomycetaceae bacterium]|nr:hypothetical protein [Planctomycetaceae bacterium]